MDSSVEGQLLCAHEFSLHVKAKGFLIDGVQQDAPGESMAWRGTLNTVFHLLL